MRSVFGVLALAPVLLSPVAAFADAGCIAARTAEVQVSRSLKGSPVAEELSAPSAQLGAGVGFARLFDDAVTVDLVLSRIRHQDCIARLPQPSAGALANSNAAYQQGQQSQQGDGQAWRFNMTQNGKRMTADEFDAWMKSRGVRVVPAKTEAAAPAPAPAPTPAPPKKKR